MRFRCPACRRVLISSAAAAVMCACGMLAHAPTHLDDEPPARAPAHIAQPAPNTLLYAAQLLPPGRQLHADQPQRRYEIDPWQPPNVALMLLQLERAQIS